MMDLVVNIALPIFLALTMFSLGLSLTVKDFSLVAQYKRPIIVGLLSIVLIVPVVGFFVVGFFQLDPALAMGMMLVVTCPGGMFSNLFTDFGKGNLALSISLTAVVSLIYIFSAPFITSFLNDYYFGNVVAVDIPVEKIAIPLFLLTLLPVFIGMLMRTKFPGFVDEKSKTIRNSSSLFVISIFVFIVYEQGSMFVENFNSVIIPMIILNLTMFLMAIMVTFFAGIESDDKISVVVEHCIRQEGAAIFVAIGLLENTTMAIPLLINSSVGLIVCSLFLAFRRWRGGFVTTSFYTANK